MSRFIRTQKKQIFDEDNSLSYTFGGNPPILNYYNHQRLQSSVPQFNFIQNQLNQPQLLIRQPSYESFPLMNQPIQQIPMLTIQSTPIKQVVMFQSPIKTIPQSTRNNNSRRSSFQISQAPQQTIAMNRSSNQQQNCFIRVPSQQCLMKPSNNIGVQPTPKQLGNNIPTFKRMKITPTSGPYKTGMTLIKEQQELDDKIQDLDRKLKETIQRSQQITNQFSQKFNIQLIKNQEPSCFSNNNQKNLEFSQSKKNYDTRQYINQQITPNQQRNARQTIQQDYHKQQYILPTQQYQIPTEIQSLKKQNEWFEQKYAHLIENPNQPKTPKPLQESMGYQQINNNITPVLQQESMGYQQIDNNLYIQNQQELNFNDLNIEHNQQADQEQCNLDEKNDYQLEQDQLNYIQYIEDQEEMQY